ncbi:MAG: RsmB/NOP family class I SAM-dependent RNA methyltransferase [Pseudomonadota bacterium]|nr:RsmB/NOP family class I SAM-dependent RNA methyltransferase [Pseudomonadota bacterium]
MKKGAILASSIVLVEKIIFSEYKAKSVINTFFRKNKFAGSKDKILIRELVFKFLKNYFTLQEICKNNLINFSFRNALLIYYFSINKKEKLKDIYEGKFSIKPEKIDSKIHKLSISAEIEIIPVLPIWLEAKLTKEFKNKLKENYRSILEEPRFDIRINEHLTDRNKILKLLNQNNILAKKTSYSPLGITIKKRILEKKIRQIKKNLFEVQDEASQIVTLLSGAKKGMKVLDYCAGKGTKTLALYEKMKAKGNIFIYDVNVDRLKVLKKRLENLKIYNKISIFNNTKNFHNYFDLILLDVPCSGSGVWRRRPDEMIKLDLNKYKNNLKIQASILKKAAKYISKNGLISYITCSLFADENEMQIKKFLSNNKAFKLVDINIVLKKELKNINLRSTYKWLTLTPNYINSDGFFICLLKKHA